MFIVASWLGWLIIAGLALTLMNYPIKKVNKLAARLPKESGLRRLAAWLTRFLTGNHRFIALFTLVALLTHMVLQVIYRWISLSGVIAAAFLLATGMIGGFGQYVRKRKRSAWFYIHRTCAVLLVAAIAVHVAMLGLPAIGSPPSPTTAETTISETTIAERVFSLDELATFNGKDGQPAYVAVDGVVYDVSALARWATGLHMNLHFAGEDLSEAILQSPHGKKMLERAKRVGVLG